MTTGLVLGIATVAWSPDELEFRTSTLPAALQAHAFQRRSHAHREGYVASRLLLAEMLRYLPTPTQEAGWKAVVASGTEGAYWSVSHTNGLVACLWSMHGPCGVDVELSQRRTEPMSIAKRYFPISEQQWLASLPDHERLAQFLDLWTRKEACLKAMQRGIANHLPDIEFKPGEMQPQRLPPDYGGRDLQLRSFLHPHWRLAAAWQGPPDELRLIQSRL